MPEMHCDTADFVKCAAAKCPPRHLFSLLSDFLRTSCRDQMAHTILNTCAKQILLPVVLFFPRRFVCRGALTLLPYQWKTHLGERTGGRADGRTGGHCLGGDHKNLLYEPCGGSYCFSRYKQVQRKPTVN